MITVRKTTLRKSIDQVRNHRYTKHEEVLRLLGCDDTLARTKPATLQYRIFHTPAILTRGGRRRRLNFPPHWPWTDHIQAIFGRLFALPAPT